MAGTMSSIAKGYWKGGKKVKNRILLVSLAAMLALSMSLIACGGEQVPEITQFDLTISSPEGGSVTTPGQGTFTYDEITVVNLVAEPDEGYRFVNWTGDTNTVADASDATTTITMDSDYSITANFAYGPAIPLKNAGSFVQMTIGDVDSLDPAWVYDNASAEQVGYIYETLVYFGGTKTDEFVPVLATEWELLDDNLTYRFKIRDGVKFHEGGDLTPSDVEYSFERALIQDRHDENWIAGPVWTLYQPLLGLECSRDGDGNIQVTFDQIDNAVEVDGDWVVFHLADPAWGLAFLQILSQPAISSPASIVDKEWCIANGEWDGTEENWEEYNDPDVSDSYLYDHTNGTGPWKLEEWDPSVEIKLARNDNYWREPAAFKTVTTQSVEDWTTRKEALLAGDADLIQVPRMYIGELEGIADLNVYQDQPEMVAFAFFLNMNIASNSSYIGSGALDGNGIPPNFFTNIDVRKGFCYAFDYDTFIEDAFLGDAQQLGSPVCEGLPYFNPDASMYSFDLAKAEEHLRAAFGGQLWEKGFKFTMLYNTGYEPRKIACLILQENLSTINSKFQVAIQPMDYGTGIIPLIKSREATAWYTGWAADYPHPDNLVVPFMASDHVFAEVQGYGYLELDELIERAFNELDPGVQKDLYYEIQERYYEDAPSIGVFQPLGRRYFTKYVQGFYFNPMIPGQAGPLYYMNKSES
jgi:peptide/nickel transport system substrate-binding protein